MQSSTTSVSILDAMRFLLTMGADYAPRGMKTIETRNYQFNVDYPFSSFTDRKFDLNYLKKEFLWYLSSNPFNDAILDASKNWLKFRQPDGKWFSNYGQYWFGPHTRDCRSGFDWVFTQLRKDPDSRQAVIPMLQPTHLFDGNPDVVCTAYINFHIRNNKLHMTVRMRSSDIIWGYGNDLPCFWWLHEMMCVALDIEWGTYTHSSDSLHVYERHFEMIHNIVQKGMDEFYRIEYPPITNVNDLLDGNFVTPFGRWLMER